MKAFSAYNDDGITVIVMASSEEEAATRTADKIAEIGFGFELDFFEDDLADAFITDDETVSDWLKKNRVEFTEENMIIMECNDIEQKVQVINL